MGKVLLPPKSYATEKKHILWSSPQCTIFFFPRNPGTSLLFADLGSLSSFAPSQAIFHKNVHTVEGSHFAPMLLWNSLQRSLPVRRRLATASESRTRVRLCRLVDLSSLLYVSFQPFACFSHCIMGAFTAQFKRTTNFKLCNSSVSQLKDLGLPRAFVESADWALLS